MVKEKKKTSKKKKKLNVKDFPTLKFKTDRDIANDFAEKVYQEFHTLIKAIVHFGSSAKSTRVAGSDIDIIILLDDASVRFDEKLALWYREKLGKIIEENPYKKDLHINTVKLTTWWEDLIKGDPTVINIIRYGDVLIDYGGFFYPLKILLKDGKIRPSPESMYTILNRVPGHIFRSRMSEMSSIEGCYWAIIETSQALLMAVKITPPSPEHVARLLKEHFVDKKLLKPVYINYINEIYDLHKKIIHGEIKNLDGKIIDSWQERSEEFFKTSVKIINSII